MRSYGALIGGEARPARTGKTIQRANPASGEVVAEYAACDATDVGDAIEAARVATACGPWPRMSGLERSRVLFDWARLVRGERTRLAEIETEEVGKIIRQSEGDLDGAIGLIEYAASLAPDIHGSVYSNLGGQLMGLMTREPVGVVGAIVPWNFPAGILCQKVPFALAAGCTVVVKPSEFTSGTALEMAALAHQAGVPGTVFNVVTGYGDPAGAALVDSPRVDMVSFTGSNATGRRVLQGQAVNFKKVSLELGGKAASVVFPDADLDEAADGVLFGVFMNQGQCCVSGARLIVHRSVAEGLAEALVARTRGFTVGDPASHETDLGPLITEAHMRKVLGHIERGGADGAELLVGGGQPAEESLQRGHFVTPTIFSGVTEQMGLFTEEVFGPVLAITEFESDEEAMRLANDTTYGLANTVWTNDVRRAMNFSAGLQSGTVYVNTTIDGAPQLAFGGYKGSGIGREMGAEGLLEFTEVKTTQLRLDRRDAFFAAAQGGAE